MLPLFLINACLHLLRKSVFTSHSTMGCQTDHSLSDINGQFLTSYLKFRNFDLLFISLLLSIKQLKRLKSLCFRPWL